MAKFNATKEAARINRMKIKGVSAVTKDIPKFTTKQKAAVKRAREQLKSLR